MTERFRQLNILPIGIYLNDFASIESTTFRKQESILGIAKNGGFMLGFGYRSSTKSFFLLDKNG